MEEIIFKTIWQSHELSHLGKGGQEPSACSEVLPGDRLEHSWKEKIWLLSKQKKSECSKIIDEEQLFYPELRRSAASTNVSVLNLSCDKKSDSSESWDFKKLQSPLRGTENLTALWSARQMDSSPTKWEDMEKLMAGSESDIMRQKLLTIKEKLRNLCQKIKTTRELEDRITSISELKIRRHFEPGSSQKQMLVQIAQSMSDLRQKLTSQLNEMKGIGSPATSMDFKRKVSLQMDNMRESPGKVSDSSQSKASLQRDEVRTRSDFHGKFETLSLQWERTQREHHRTTQMLRDLKLEIDSIANNSKKMSSAFDQIQKNLHKLSHIKPLIENIQKLLERRKKQWSIEPGYLSSDHRGREQGEVLQQLVDQAVLPLVERVRRLHHASDCSTCGVKSKQNLMVP